MSDIITDSGYVNSYLQNKARAKTQAEKKQAETANTKLEISRQMALTPDDLERKKHDMILANAVGAELVKHYPGHGWEVESDIGQGVVKVFNKYMSGIYGYLIHTKNIRHSTFSADIMRIGGEILDRFGISRGKFDEAEVANVQRDHKGSARIDLT